LQKNIYMIYFTLFILFFLVALCVLQIVFEPVIDNTRSGKIILWYGRKNRKFVILKD